jgi:hypothetical protein
MVSFIMSSGWKKKILPERLPAALNRYDAAPTTRSPARSVAAIRMASRMQKKSRADV